MGRHELCQLAGERSVMLASISLQRSIYFLQPLLTFCCGPGRLGLGIKSCSQFGCGLLPENPHGRTGTTAPVAHSGSAAEALAVNIELGFQTEFRLRSCVSTRDDHVPLVEAPPSLDKGISWHYNGRPILRKLHEPHVDRRTPKR